MPYEAQSPLGSLIGLATGFLQGRQQKQQDEYQRQLQAQELARQNAAMQLEMQRYQAEQANANRQFQIESAREKREEDAANRAAGVDPVTGKQVMTELPKNMTQGVANSIKGTLEQQYAHNIAVAQWLDSRGYKEAAQPFLDNARSIATQINQIRSQSEQDKREQERLQQQLIIHQMPTYRDLHPRAGSSAQGVDLDTYQKAVQLINDPRNPNPQATADDIVSKVIAHGGSSKTAEAIRAAGDAAQRRYNQAHPSATQSLNAIIQQAMQP